MDISKITLPTGTTFDIKDAVARSQLGGAIRIKGTTTTALTDEATTNPIIIDGNSYTAVSGDAVFYSKKEFVFDGTKWHEFGDMSGLGDVAYINKDGIATHFLNGSGSWTTPAHQTIKQDGITGATVNRYALCSTAGDTAAKTASITAGTFSLGTGSIVNVKFENINSANSPTLNINSTGAKNIFSNGAQITTGTNKWLLKGLCTFIYDGTQYHLVGGYIDTDTHYTTHLYAGTGAAANATTTNGNTKITVADNTTARDSVTVKGTGAASVSSDANGVITINSDATESWNYDGGSFLEGVTTISGLNSGIAGFIDGKLASEYMNIPCGIVFSSNASSQNIAPFGPGKHYQGFIYHMEGRTSSAAEYAVVLFDVATGDIFVNAHTSSGTWGTWRKTGSLAWKSSGTYDKTTGGSASVSLKIPTSKSVAVSIEPATPNKTAATNEVIYTAVTNETLILNKIKYTTGTSINIPSSATAYTGTITPTHTSTNVTFS